MREKLLRHIPSVDELLKAGPMKEAISGCGLQLATEAVREILCELRDGIVKGEINDVSTGAVTTKALSRLKEISSTGIVRVVNATGAVLHTNTGRAVLGQEAVKLICLAAESNINLEISLSDGERGERDSIVEGLIKRLAGASSACVVNNNAAAVLVALNTLAEGREVVISRGELVEIGGSFRLPDIIKKSGCVLREVGTTNRTHASDYASAINPNTALIFKAHTSNFRVVGFHKEVLLKELKPIAKKAEIPIVHDLGSGSLVDLRRYGLPYEPTVAESLVSGADIVTFSGDKLLGGPQAGIIAGNTGIIEGIRKNPLKRALRIDKLTIAGLEATLRLYLNKDALVRELPTLRFLTRPVSEIEDACVKASQMLKLALGEDFNIEITGGESVAGSGALPGAAIPTRLISISHRGKGPHEIFKMFLESRPSILGRISKDRFLLDMRTILDPAAVVPAKKVF